MTAAERRDADALWREMREEAEAVPCERCGAPIREHCRNTMTGGVLAAPAHPQRIKAAEEAQ